MKETAAALLQDPENEDFAQFVLGDKGPTGEF